VIELLLLRTQAGFDIAQPLAKRQLRKTHGQILIPARKSLNLVVPIVPPDTGPEIVDDNKLHQLRKHRSASIHQSRLLWGRRDFCKMTERTSNR
jgi:hypothetical protein